MTEKQQIKVGQVWRRKRDGKHIRIVRACTSFDDWAWKGEDYKGRGQSYGEYILRDYELVDEG